MAAEHYHAHAYGGVQVDALYGGGAPSSALAPSTAHLTQAAWDDTEILDPKFCSATSSKTNMQCRAYPVKGEEYCTFHLKAHQHGTEPGSD